MVAVGCASNKSTAHSICNRKKTPLYLNIFNQIVSSRLVYDIWISPSIVHVPTTVVEKRGHASRMSWCMARFTASNRFCMPSMPSRSTCGRGGGEIIIILEGPRFLVPLSLCPSSTECQIAIGDAMIYRQSRKRGKRLYSLLTGNMAAHRIRFNKQCFSGKHTKLTLTKDKASYS